MEEGLKALGGMVQDEPMRKALLADQGPIESAPAHFMDSAPEAQIATMKHVASLACAVIEERQWFKEIRNRKHIRVEGWQFIAALMRCAAKIMWSRETKEGNGFEAHAVLVRADTGIEISGADGMCSRDEENWGKRDDYAVRSMAQTRAVSRVVQHVFRFVAELGGYDGTPAEEVPPGGFLEAPKSVDFKTRARDAAERAKADPKHPVHRKLAGARTGRMDTVVGGARRVSTEVLARLAAERGIGLEEFGGWLVEHIAHDLRSRKKAILTDAETQAAKAALEKLPRPSGPPQQPSDQQKAYLFALHSAAGHDDDARHEIYEMVCGKHSFKELTRMDVANLIEAMTERK